MNNLIKIIIGIIILLGVAALGIFIYNKYQKSNIPAASPTPVFNSAEEGEKIKELAENFVSSYASYQKGSFSSLKETEKMMTKKYQEETARFIEEKEKELSTIKNKEYLSYTGIPKNTSILSMDPQKASAAVEFESNIFYGAYTYINGSLTTINQKGERTSQPLKRETAGKKAIISMIKENGAWKVDSIKIE